MGQCICVEWNSFVEERVLPVDTNPAARSGAAGSKGPGGGRPEPLKKVGTADYDRIDTGIGELNRVLGGGMVKGSLVLISGEPGIGKSTIIIQTAANIAASGRTVLYVSGEESEEQIKLRADRVCSSIPDSLYVLAETNLENVEAACENLKPAFLIIDSIQTLYSSQLDSAPGSVSQVRLCGNILMKVAKTNDVPVFIVAHVTKSGDLAGPKTVEHLVDCEIGAFKMEAEGLKEVRDISATFLERNEEMSEGSVTAAIYEGSRPVMFEIQALVSPANVGFARRTAVGIDNQRLSMILAVMEKIVGLQLINQDVYVNVVGGIRPEGTGTDLAAALAVYSSYKRAVPKKRTLAVGEVGLTGDLRAVQNTEKIVKEAARLGYEQVIMPVRNAEKIGRQVDGCRVIGAKNIQEAFSAFTS